MTFTEISHFGTSFVALRALVREIIPNTIRTHLTSHPQTYLLHDRDRISIYVFDSGFAPSALSIRLNSWWHAWHDSVGGNAVCRFC